MELEKQVLQTEKKKGTASTQVTFDQDYHLPDYLPDFYTVILSRGEIRVDECKMAPGNVMIRGALKFQVLYRTDQNESGISSLEGEFPIQETLVLEEADEFDMPQIRSALEDLSVRRMNGRKLNIRALISLQASAWERQDLEIPVGAAETGAVPPQMRYETKTFLALLYRGKERCRIREEVRLPSSQPNVRQLVWQQAQLYDENIRVSDGLVTVSGNIQMFVLYLAQETNKLQWYEEKIPCQCSFDIPQAQSDVIPYVTVHVQDLICSVSPDADGEERAFLIEAELLCDIWLFQEQKKEVLTDLYALDRQLLLQEKPAMPACLRMKNETDCRINDTIPLEETLGDILQICAGFGRAITEHSSAEQDGILVDGTLSIQIIFLTSNDRAPVAATEAVLPFQCKVEIPGMRKESEYELDTSVEQLSLMMKSGKELELQAVIRIRALAVDRTEIRFLDTVDEKEMDMDEFHQRPSMVGLTFREGDSLWKIARMYHTTIAEICKTNGLENEHPAVGTHLLIIKQVAQIPG